jgi:Thaumarchaeal output domain 1
LSKLIAVICSRIDAVDASEKRSERVHRLRVRKEMQKTEKKGVFELDQDRYSQALIGKFLSGEIKTLEPVYKSKGGYSYPVIEEMLGDASQVGSFLSKLSDSGVLDKTLFDKVIFCPKCSSANISFRYCCPFCKSFDIQKSSLVEHVKCGYMDLEANFRQGDKYVCPKCHEEMQKIDVDYRKAGVWCSCKNCNKSFDIPVSEHFCRSCNASSTFEEASIKEVYAYTLSKNIKADSYLGLLLSTPIQELLVEEGFTVRSPASLKGKSGATHSFDIVAHKGDANNHQGIIVVDLATSTGAVVSEQNVIALFAKVFDVSPEKAYLIAIPKLNENGKRMAELYNIRLIEAENAKEATKALRASLKN